MESSKKVKEDKLVVIGAREHNLQNISVTIRFVNT